MSQVNIFSHEKDAETKGNLTGAEFTALLGNFKNWFELTMDVVDFFSPITSF